LFVAQRFKGGNGHLKQFNLPVLPLSDKVSDKVKTFASLPPMGMNIRHLQVSPG
jgi:hypothetical protein